MRFPSYISKSRHGIYYLRVVTPKAVQLANPNLPKEIRKSLNTRCPREAAVRSRHLALDWRHIMSEMTRALMSPSDDYKGQLIISVLPDGGYSLKVEDGDPIERTREYLQLLREIGKVPLNAGTLDVMGHENPTDKELREARLEARSVKLGGIWLSDLIQAFGDECLQTKRWGTDTTWFQSYRPILRDFREIVSKSKRSVMTSDGRPEEIWDIHANQLAEEHLQIFCEAMFKFPKNYGSRKDVKDAKQALSMGLPPQDRSNAFKKIRMLKTFLIWAYKKKKLSEQLDDLLPNEQPDKKRDKSTEGYQPFTDKELKKIFERENYPLDGWRYWTPLLALYTGARANEIAQLLVSDIVTSESGIPCIVITDMPDIVDDDEPIAIEAVPIKSVKTAASRRWVPIHPKLLECGFLEFVGSVKDKGETRLFSDLSYSKVGGYARNVSRNFAEVTKSLGIWVPRKKVFHSFRGTLNGRLLKLGTSQELREFVLGHTNDSMNVQKYGKLLSDRPYNAILEELSKVDFGLMHKPWEPSITLPQF